MLIKDRGLLWDAHVESGKLYSYNNMHVYIYIIYTHSMTDEI